MPADGELVARGVARDVLYMVRAVFARRNAEVVLMRRLVVNCQDYASGAAAEGVLARGVGVAPRRDRGDVSCGIV